MHLLAAQSGELQQEGEAVDLGQSPGAMIFVSAADSEVASMAFAAYRSGETQLRCANLMALSHNLSVDTWLGDTVSHAKVIIVRLLGGMAYWRYGVEQLAALAHEKKITLILLPGDAAADETLQNYSTIDHQTYHLLHRFFISGGPDNFDMVLASMRQLAAGQTPQNQPAKPFPQFTLWWPGQGAITPDQLKSNHTPDAAHVPLLFYRAVLDGAGTSTVNRLIKQLVRSGLNPVPMVVSSLKQADCVTFARSVFAQFPPDIILNLTGFALGLNDLPDDDNPFAKTDAPILQLVQTGRARDLWAKDNQGLSAKDLAMHVVLPELDGRLAGLLVGHKEQSVWHEATECWLTQYDADADGIASAVDLARNWVRLRHTNNAQKRVALVLANYPVRDGRLANGVGYDAPQSTVRILKLLVQNGYDLQNVPTDGNTLIERLQQGPTNADPQRGKSGATVSLDQYQQWFGKLPLSIRQQVTDRWGDPANDPFCRGDKLHLPVLHLGNVAILIQPARGYDLDIDTTYHDPDLVPPHAYLAAYLWVRHGFNAHAIIHNGKHGNLEWLPGKATALDANSYPHALWASLPHLYPFIVNDPGEGTQAKRRTGAVIIDHLVPPLTRAETYGPLKDLEALLDEYYQASGMDQRRLNDLKTRIINLTRDEKIDRDIGLEAESDDALTQIDNFLCELKEAQIRDGLHIFGHSPEGHLRTDLALALARVPRGEGSENQSLIRALADDLALGFDPLDVDFTAPWTGPRPDLLQTQSSDMWRTIGDTVERLELLAANLIAGEVGLSPDLTQTRFVLEAVTQSILPRLDACGPSEAKALLDGLNGKFVLPGASGAPSRGRLDVLPTGRNFYSVDNRAVPTQTAWELGKKSAENIILRHFQDHGTYLRAVALSVWGTANMRTGGDDIAQAMALIGVKPKWDPGSLRVSGFEIIPLAKLGRPRVDVTLKISGLFRDAFPQMIALFDRAVRAVGALDEPDEQNPIAAVMRVQTHDLMEKGLTLDEAGLAAGHRIFGSKPGAYGAGLQALIDSGHWQDKSDLSDVFVEWGQYAYGAKVAGIPDAERFKNRLAAIDAVLHNQDNREHDLLDSDDYYQFEGGLIAAAETLSGNKPATYHSDHSRPERPRTRTLDEEISFVMRSRVVNPKWIEGVKRHGYKGAFEIIATIDYMFAFAATTGAVKSHHFDLAFDAFIANKDNREFIRSNNPYGYDELIAKLKEAMDRGFWLPKSNSVFALIEEDNND